MRDLIWLFSPNVGHHGLIKELFQQRVHIFKIHLYHLVCFMSFWRCMAFFCESCHQIDVTVLLVNVLFMTHCTVTWLCCYLLLLFVQVMIKPPLSQRRHIKTARHWRLRPLSWASWQKSSLISGFGPRTCWDQNKLEPHDGSSLQELESLYNKMKFL